MGDGMNPAKKEYLGLATRLETSISAGQGTCRCDKMIEVFKKLRMMLETEDLSLSRREKVRLLKIISRAKIKAFMSEKPHGRDTFHTLNSISSDVIQLL
jgi:hypothetical protein